MSESTWPELDWAALASLGWPAMVALTYSGPPLRPGAAALGLAIAGVEPASLVAIGTIDGVVITAVSGKNAPGIARIRSRQVGGGTALSWYSPGLPGWGPDVPIAGDGVYTLFGLDPNQWICVAAYTAFLLPMAEAQVFVRDVYANGIAAADVTADQASAGSTTSSAAMLTNYGAKTMLALTAWLDAATVGHSLSLDGVTYVAATAAAPLALGDLVPGASLTLYLQRTTPAATASAPKLLTDLHFSWQETLS